MVVLKAHGRKSRNDWNRETAQVGAARHSSAERARVHRVENGAIKPATVNGVQAGETSENVGRRTALRKPISNCEEQ